MKVLVYHIGQLGDTIVSIPALRAVRQHFGYDTPVSMLHDVTGNLVTASMVLEGSSLVDEFIPYTPQKTVWNKLRTMVDLWFRLRRGKFDTAVSLLPSDRSPRALLRDRCFFYACGIRQTVGFQAYPDAEIRPRQSTGRPARTLSEAVLRLRRLFADGVGTGARNLFSLPLLSVDRHRAVSKWLEDRRKHPDRPLVALCPGCKKAGNVWPTERFLEIARRLEGMDRFEIVILGGPAERELADSMVEALGGRAIHAAGRFSVMESAALLADCALLIGLDTGTTHLAAAVGVRCVVIQSASSFPGQWDPLGRTHTVIRANVRCEGCLQQACVLPGHPCMRKISVEQVWSAVKSVLANTKNEPYTAPTHV